MTESLPPAKRGPGRPRKQPVVPTADDATEGADQGRKDIPSDPNDERIGMPVDPRWLTVGYSDGGQYRCEDGFIVERTG